MVPVGSGTEAGRVYLTNGKHDDESNSSDFLTDFLQQSNQGKDKSRLLSFTQHFSLCQEFFICHKNIIHMLHRLWIIFSKPSAMYPAAPKLSVIWAGQQMANTPSALPLECPRVWEEDPLWHLSTKEENQMLLAVVHREPTVALLKHWKSLEPSLRVNAMRNSCWWSSYQFGWL